MKRSLEILTVSLSIGILCLAIDFRVLAGQIGGAPYIGTVAASTVSGILPYTVGGTSNTTFLAPSSGIRPVVIFDGSKLATNSSVQSFGYNAASDIVYTGGLSVIYPHTSVATFTNNDTSHGPSGGSGMIGYTDPASAVSSGDRLGFMLFGGAVDAVHTLVNSTGLAGFATENWSSTNQGSQSCVYTTPNGSTTAARRCVVTFGQDGSTLFSAASGATAVTQTFGDVSSRVATDQFVASAVAAISTPVQSWHTCALTSASAVQNTSGYTKTVSAWGSGTGVTLTVVVSGVTAANAVNGASAGAANVIFPVQNNALYTVTTSGGTLNCAEFY